MENIVTLKGKKKQMQTGALRAPTRRSHIPNTKGCMPMQLGAGPDDINIKQYLR